MAKINWMSTGTPKIKMSQMKSPTIIIEKRGIDFCVIIEEVETILTPADFTTLKGLVAAEVVLFDPQPGLKTINIIPLTIGSLTILCDDLCLPAFQTSLNKL